MLNYNAIKVNTVQSSKKEKKAEFSLPTYVNTISILAWIFFSAGITLQEIIVISITVFGAVLVQLRRRMAL